jgi:hypothetical protein
MVHPHGMPYRKKRQAFPVGQQYPRPLHPDRRFRARAANLLNAATSMSLIANSIDHRHPAMTFIHTAESTVSLHAIAKNGILAHRHYTISVMESMY